MYPNYPPLPLKGILAVLWAILTGKKRSFRNDAMYFTNRWNIIVEGKEHIPQNPPALILTNHYHRPGFQAFWFALAINACLPEEAIWTMTGAWTNDGSMAGRIRAWLSPRLFPRLANVYGFIIMPPMPPRPEEVEARATAIRQLLLKARQSPKPILAFVPEGMDSPDGKLMRPFPGVGRVLLTLEHLGYPFYPVGVFENEQALILKFGPPLKLKIQQENRLKDLDRSIAEQVMMAIACLLPNDLRGEFNCNEGSHT